MPKGQHLPEVNIKTRIKPLDDMKGQELYDKVFGVRLPKGAAEKMLKLDTKQRTLLMRRAILNELEKISN